MNEFCPPHMYVGNAVDTAAHRVARGGRQGRRETAVAVDEGCRMDDLH